MQPIAHRCGVVAGHTLRYLIGMMGRNKIHATAVNIELLTQILRAHG